MTRVVVLAALAACVCACTPVDPEPEVGPDGEVLPAIPEYDRALTIESVRPDVETLGPRPWLAVRFDAHLDDDTFRSFGVMQLVAGGLIQRGEVRHVVTERTLYWRPYSDLRDGFLYTLDYTLAGVESVTGSPMLDDPEGPIFRVDTTLESEPFPLDDSPVSFDEVDAIFSERCVSCHGQSSWPQLVSLDEQSLGTTRQEQLGRVLVRAGDPADSYLLQKVLPDYPDRLNGPCPPTWSDDPEPLTPDELWLIERWIRNPAR